MTKKQQNEQNRSIRDEATLRVQSRRSWIEKQRETFERYVGRFEVLLAMDLDIGATAVEALPRSDWKKWGEEASGLSGKTLYRWRNAGRVAVVLTGDGTDEKPNLLGDIPAASIGHLVPFYRCFSGRSAEDAEALIRTTWATLVADLDDEEVLDENGATIIVQIPPTLKEATEAAERVAPTSRSGGGRSSDEDDDERGTERGTTPVPVDPRAVEAATGPVAAILKQQAEALSADEVLVRGAFLAAMRLAEEHGISVVQAVLVGVTAPADEPTAADEEAANAAAEAAAA